MRGRTRNNQGKLGILTLKLTPTNQKDQPFKERKNRPIRREAGKAARCYWSDLTSIQHRAHISHKQLQRLQ